MDVGTDPGHPSQARQPAPDSSEREARRLRAPGIVCPVCGEPGEITETKTQVIPRISTWPTHVTFYRCVNGHTWQFPS